MKHITILLAEDHAFVREGFRKMLELETDLEVIGEAQDGRQAIAMTLERCPDLVLMDIAMPRLNGLEATRQLLKESPATKVLILSAHNDDAYVKSAMESGASGYLLKQASAHGVCQAIRKVMNGEMSFSSLISKRLSRITPQSSGLRGDAKMKIMRLTSRESEVLQLIAEGKTNKETASELGISIKTVEKHRGQLMQKLDIHDTASLTRYAIATGIIESSVQVIIV
jgi:DNA-binding NarL/FixJ family response regulator